jgi:ADP-ribosyl-[dinitrogen reductase] hydrolase
MLLELAIGDAYGAGFEYSNENVAKHNNLSGYVRHPRHREILAGMYTDDTQMSIAIAELIIEDSEWTPLNIANKFLECFKRDERTGYSGNFYDFLKSVTNGEEFLKRIQPDSDKSGAAMRAVPLGVLSPIEEVKERCHIQAAVTHDTPDGIHAAQAAALMSHYFVYQLGAKADVGLWLEKQLPKTHQWNEDYKGKVKAQGWMSVRAAITAVKRNDSLSALLKDCIAFTGDVDTVATIALGAASNSPEYLQDLPQVLIDTLENRNYGRDYLLELDNKLMALVK